MMFSMEDSYISIVLIVYQTISILTKTEVRNRYYLRAFEPAWGFSMFTGGGASIKVGRGL